MPKLLGDIVNIIVSPGTGKDDLKKVLEVYVTTDLQRKNLDLVIEPAWNALKNKINP